MADNKENKVLNVPALRFSELTEEWKDTTLDNECTINPTSDKLKAEFVYIDLESVEKGELTKKQVIEKASAPSRAQRVLQNGDVLFQCVRPYQKNNYLVKDVSPEIQWVASTGYAQLRTKKNNPAFIYHLLNTSSFNKKVIVRCTGSSYPAINSDDLSKIHFYICGIEEQKRIADFLSLLDERIATQNKIIEKLETLIKGIVVTHHRKCPYKQFVEISKLGKSFSVGVLSKEDLVEDGTPCILYGELFTTYNCVADVIESRTNRTDNQVYSKGDELLFPASTTVDAVSLITPTALIVANVVLGGDMFGIHINKEYNAIYISYILNYVYRQRIAKYAQGCTIIHLHYKDIKNFKLSLPPIEKQEKIVNTLNSMQEKIDCEKQNLRLLNDLRSFLLSKLFI